MRNRIDFRQAPEDLFLDPATDPGLRFLTEPEFIWRPHKQGRIVGFAVSDHDVMRTKTEKFLRFTRHHKTFRQAIEFNSSLVLLENASFRKSYAMAHGKCLLSGAAGTRLLNRYCWENEDAPDDPETRLVRYFSERQSVNRAADLPIHGSQLPDGVDFAIECRNTFNFYHFVTETLCHLCLLADIDFAGRIYVHFPNSEDKTRGFTTAFVDALFPEFRGRVFFERSPKNYDQVLTAYNLFNSYYLLPPEVTAPVDDIAPSDELWRGAEATRSSQAVLSMNSFDRNLARLRARALSAIAEKNFDHLPRRFFVGRKPGASRLREMVGQDQLLEVLHAFGFAEVAFEDMDPLEQIAIMARAEIMISPHGAGFTNMLFANPDAIVIELGTLQTAIHRWGDFWPLAIVSGCRYVSFFADHDSDDPLAEPSFSTDGIVPVALGTRGLGEVLAFVAASIGRYPQLTRAEDVARLVHQLTHTDQTDHALAVLDRHDALRRASVDLSLAAADLRRARGEVKSELVALTDAWAADKTRWQTLVQIIWCARKAGKTEVVAWAVRLMSDLFPERCLDLVKGREWLKQYL